MEPYDDRYYIHFRGFLDTFNPVDKVKIDGIRFLFEHAISVWDSLPDALPDPADLYGDPSDPGIVYALTHPEEWHQKQESNLYTALLIYRASFYRAKNDAPLFYQLTPYYTAMQSAGYQMGLEYDL